MDQKIEEIKIENIVLWTENPRDPIDPKSSDQDIADKAWKDKDEKWKLKKLAKEMRTHYDFSELPTVVYHGKIPIVYDGNRRMILAKLKHNIVNLDGFDKNILPFIPEIISCNVCTEDIAIQNVLRKHAGSGSWTPLNRDFFAYKFLKAPKSTFLKLDEATSVISANSHLNQGFVKNEIFTSEKLKEIGFEFNQDNMESKHSESEAETIFQDISSKVVAKKITTRKNRGEIMNVLEKSTRDIIEVNKNKSLNKIEIRASSYMTAPKQKQSARTKMETPEIFGGILYLKHGQISDFYRDIVDLYNYYQKEKVSLSQYFPSLIRMSLRLLCEAAASDSILPMDNYLKSNFKTAKENLDKDMKTTLSSQNVRENTILQLLHIGAHNYQAGNNLVQTVAISIILGEILTITHGK